MGHLSDMLLVSRWPASWVNVAGEAVARLNGKTNASEEAIVCNDVAGNMGTIVSDKGDEVQFYTDATQSLGAVVDYAKGLENELHKRGNCKLEGKVEMFGKLPKMLKVP